MVATLLTILHNFGCRASDFTSPALVAYVIMQATNSVTFIRIIHLMGSPCCPLDLKHTIVADLFSDSRGGGLDKEGYTLDKINVDLQYIKLSHNSNLKIILLYTSFS